MKDRLTKLLTTFLAVVLLVGIVVVRVFQVGGIIGLEVLIRMIVLAIQVKMVRLEKKMLLQIVNLIV